MYLVVTALQEVADTTADFILALDLHLFDGESIGQALLLELGIKKLHPRVFLDHLQPLLELAVGVDVERLRPVQQDVDGPFAIL